LFKHTYILSKKEALFAAKTKVVFFYNSLELRLLLKRTIQIGGRTTQKKRPLQAYLQRSLFYNFSKSSRLLAALLL